MPVDETPIPEDVKKLAKTLLALPGVPDDVAKLARAAFMECRTLEGMWSNGTGPAAIARAIMADRAARQQDTEAEGFVIGDIADLDKAAERWADAVGWRGQLAQIMHLTNTVVGNRVDGKGGPELRMLILRQRNLIDRWVRQAFSEGLLARESSDERLVELEELFEATWAADMRAVKRWREAHPGNDLTLPDRADMVVWLMEQLPPTLAPTPPDQGGETT